MPHNSVPEGDNPGLAPARRRLDPESDVCEGLVPWLRRASYLRPTVSDEFVARVSHDRRGACSSSKGFADAVVGEGNQLSGRVHARSIPHRVPQIGDMFIKRGISRPTFEFKVFAKDQTDFFANRAGNILRFEDPHHVRAKRFRG